MSDYIVSVRGPVPGDLVKRVSQMHAAAVKAAPAPAAKSREGEKEARP